MVVRAERIAAVRGAGQGSGYLLSPRLVLTAAHVVRSDPWAPPPDTVEAAVPGGRGWVRGTVVWMPASGSRHLDAALVRTDEDLVDGPGAALPSELRWGRTDGLQPLPHCHLTGYPAAARAEDGRLDSTQVAGTLMPGSGLLSHRLVLNSDHTPPAGPPGAASPWAGISGAGVFFRDRLMGLAVEDRQPGAWQHAQLTLVPVADLLAVAGFAEAMAGHGVPRPRLEIVSDQEADDAGFEQRHAESVRVDHGKLRIFGLDLSRARSRLSDLDTAYLSLEARPLRPEGPGRTERRLPARVEEVLRGRTRVLLRGQAGSGKTTLLQWLAVHAAEGTLGDVLAGWNDRVPFVLRLRTMYRLRNLHPRPEEYLAMDSSPLAGAQPPGWADRVLRAGRAMLLVDGMDEIPQEERDEAQEWLAGVLGHYPGTLCVVTVRPSAVAGDWLGHLGFDELTLCPMRKSDRETLIDRWYDAARGEPAAGGAAPHEIRELDGLKAALKRTLSASPDLDALTDSPLLCAMICALHRDWDGALPHRKMDVYEAALNMLLVRRDQQRKVGEAAGGVRLDKEEKLALLQKIAAWLAEAGLVETGRREALHQIERIRPALSMEARSVAPQVIYQHLLDRSGLLSETGVETFEFLHRTFQDYLAAREFRDDRAFVKMVRHAHDEQWADIIRMAAGHSSVRDRSDLVQALLDLAAGSTGDRARSVVFLAASCLPYMPLVAPDARERVRAALERVLREQGDSIGHRQWQQLAMIGPEVLASVPALSGGEADRRYVELVAAVGGRAACDKISSMAGSMTPRQLGWAAEKWKRFEDEELARRLLRAADLTSARMQVQDRRDLAMLAGAGPIGILEYDGLADGTTPDFEGIEAATVWLTAGGLADLECLGSISGLIELVAFDDLLPDLGRLDGVPLRSVTVWAGGAPAEAERFYSSLHGRPDLCELQLGASLLDHLGAHVLTGVEDLVLSDVGYGDVGLGVVRRSFPSLTALTLRFQDVPDTPVDLSPLAGPGGPRIVLEVAVPRYRDEAHEPLGNLVTGLDAIPDERLAVDYA
ncbi:NACHT domain-containing protein [Kitasatospora indigofera]|uniref:NACHT domain-containing protein n=1 Tax=Kitasatospora indigofera TaxID=67307 RepID=UPI0032537F12